MRLLHQDRKTGEIKFQVDNMDDLWHLYNIIELGDLVLASTYRREEQKSDKVRNERGEKKRVFLGIRVEKMEFHEFDSRLRITGVIEQGPQDLGAHHTFNVEEGEVLTVVKLHWKDSTLDRIKRALEDSKRPTIVFVSIENDEATIAVMRQYGMQNLATICGPSGGKMYEQKTDDDFYLEIIEKVGQLVTAGVPLIVLGPGFAKETLLALGKQKAPEAFRNVHVYHTGQAGMAGVHELMKRGMGADILEGSRVAEETNLVEKVLEEIAKDGPVAYGPREVEEAVRSGAVETLLVLDPLLREKDLEALMNAVESSRGRVMVVSEHHEAGRKLEALGGMAALLRFRLQR
ncbi:MAG: mRNA surveillance protein pelota [Methanomassiliicoccales archaeon]|jgi:protein pelota|nr:mRNA surveillance protein pelota [Methanomassiliicoccales archaeon]MDD1757022.1 mRNA surveillance protein pelota [Methanomassiliicoccales archaeon]